MVSSRTAGGNSSRASCKQEHKYRRQLFVKLVPEETQLLCIDNCSLIKGTNVSQADLSHQKHTSLHETQLLHVCVFGCHSAPFPAACGRFSLLSGSKQTLRLKGLHLQTRVILVPD